MTDHTYTKVKQYIDRYHMIKAQDLVIAGVSGGADSVCLLHLLWRMRRERGFRLLVVHVDHGVRTESGEDAAYVEALCRKLEVPFYLRKVDMNGYALRMGLSPEEAGRELRYQAFAEVLEAQIREGESCRIAVAHNSNDRAETMLFHLFRGSGIKGLSSIQPVREVVIRPILCLERAEIEQYLQKNRLSYCRDRTNEEDTYTRNRIRHHILSYAQKEICAGVVAHMGELAETLTETERYLAEQTRRVYEECVEEISSQKAVTFCGRSGTEAAGSSGNIGAGSAEDVQTVCLRIKSGALSQVDPVLSKRVLLMCMERLTPHRKDITRQHIAELEKLMDRDGSKELSLPYGIRAYKEYDRLYLIREMRKTGQENKTADLLAGRRQPDGESSKEAGASESYRIEPPMEIFLPGEGTFVITLLEKEAGFCEKEENIPQNRYTKWFDYDKITTSLLLRTRQQGDYLSIDAAMHTKSVKQYMINEKIPKMQRDRMHLLADGSHILWVPGYRISQGYKVDGSTERILQVRFRGGSNGGTN